MNKKSYSIILKIISIICVITILFSACESGVSTKTVRFEKLKTVNAEAGEESLHKISEKSYKPICKSGLIELLFDKNTCTVAIRDTNSGNLWTTLPNSSITKQITSSPIEVVLSDGSDTVYVLNSQDNSVAFGNAEYTASDDGILVKYALSLDAETGKANISELENGCIRVDLSVLYTLRDGSFYVDVSMNNVKLPKGVYLEKISILKDFGAYEKSGAEDYIFVPDGSGALIMTGVKNDDAKPINLNVYEDGCLLGAFGMKRGNGAFLCIIEHGDTIAEINAARNGENTLNSVYSSFNTTEILEKDGRKIKKTYGYEYRNEITLCYRFLSGKSATYSGMATACRENLIRNSVLSTKALSETAEELPLIVSVQGGYINEKGKYSVLSDYEQTLSLMMLLKAKGVNNIFLRYNGLYSDANNGSDSSFGNFKSSLGTDKKYNELYSYINSQKFSLFLETDILTYKYNGKGAKFVDGTTRKSAPTGSFPFETDPQSYLKMSKLEKKIEDILNASGSVNFDGYALNDIGSNLYSDYSRTFYSKISAKKEISAQLPVLATSKKIMVDNGNFYSVKNADIITNIPLSPCAEKENIAYVGIPFVQIMLHGICEYSGKGINTESDINTAFLKSIEYGCLPGADWYCTSFKEEIDSKYFYDKNINDIVSGYEKANDALASLRDARITSHYKVQDGVYCTEYNNSEKVYVNYTDKDVTINGIKIPSVDCVKI